MKRGLRFCRRPRLGLSAALLVAVAAVAERPGAELFVAAQAELVRRVVVEFDESWRSVMTVATGEVSPVLDVVEGHVAVVRLEDVGRLGGERV